MTSPTRSRPDARPNSPGVSAADLASGASPRTGVRADAAQAARDAVNAQRAMADVRSAQKVRSAEEIQQATREEAERKAAIPPWYMRKRYLLPIFALGLAAVAGSSMVGSAPEPPAPPVERVVPSIAAPSIGTTVTEGDLAFTLRSVTLPGDTIGETVGAERASQTWLLVEVEIANNGRGKRTLDATQQTLVDAGGTVYPASVVPSLPGWDQVYIAGIGAGESATANIAFDVPASATFTTLRLTDGQSGKGVDLPLR